MVRFVPCQPCFRSRASLIECNRTCAYPKNLDVADQIAACVCFAPKRTSLDPSTTSALRVDTGHSRTEKHLCEVLYGERRPHSMCHERAGIFSLGFFIFLKTIPYCTLRESKSQFDSALSWRLQTLVRSWLRSVDIVAAGPSQGRAGPRCPEMSYGVISQLRASPQKRDGP